MSGNAFDPPPVLKERGYYDWAPHGKTRILLEAVEQVLTDYAAQLPLTGRQVFYILIGRGEWTKAQGDRAVGNVIYRARRAGMFSFDDFRDDGHVQSAPAFFDDSGDFLDGVRAAAKAFKLDRQADQDAYLEVWCEAAGMVPQLERVAHDYGVPVYSGGGFDSDTAKHLCAQRIADRDVPTTVLSIGDLDPDGRMLVRARAEDIAAFADEDGAPEPPEFVTIALTGEQVEGPPPLPVEPFVVPATNRRKYAWWPVPWKAQAEALDPATLAATVREAIESRVDLDQYTTVLDEEKQAREAVLDALPDADDEDETP